MALSWRSKAMPTWLSSSAIKTPINILGTHYASTKAAEAADAARATSTSNTPAAEAAKSAFYSGLQTGATKFGLGALAGTAALGAAAPKALTFGNVAKIGALALDPPSFAGSLIGNTMGAAFGITPETSTTGKIASSLTPTLAGMAFGPAGALVGGLVSGLVGDVLGDITNSRSFEMARDEMEDQYGWGTGHQMAAALSGQFDGLATNAEMNSYNNSIATNNYGNPSYNAFGAPIGYAGFGSLDAMKSAIAAAKYGSIKDAIATNNFAPGTLGYGTGFNNDALGSAIAGSQMSNAAQARADVAAALSQMGQQYGWAGYQAAPESLATYDSIHGNPSWSGTINGQSVFGQGRDAQGNATTASGNPAAAGGYSGVSTAGMDNALGDVGINSDNGGGAPGGGCGSVICAELVRRGEYDRKLYAAEWRFLKKHLTTTQLRGYHYWAVPLVKKMRAGSKLWNHIGKWMMYYADEIAYQAGAKPSGSWRGKAIKLVAEPLCGLIGRFVKYDKLNRRWDRKDSERLVKEGTK